MLGNVLAAGVDILYAVVKVCSGVKDIITVVCCCERNREILIHILGSNL